MGHVIFERLGKPLIDVDVKEGIMETTIMQCILMIEKEIWTTGNKQHDTWILVRLKNENELSNIRIKYLYKEYDNELCLTEMIMI